MATLRGDLQRLLNSHSAENKSNTPDFILAEFVMRSLEVFDSCVSERDKWYGYENLGGRKILLLNP